MADRNGAVETSICKYFSNKVNKSSIRGRTDAGKS